MREILFKAKRIDNGKWVQGAYVKRGKWTWIKGKKVTHFILVQDEYGFTWREIDIDTLCQFTGLTDKNGKRIWENDIVKYHFGEDIAMIKFGEYQSCFDSAKTCHVGFYVEWKNNLRKDLDHWIKMIDCNVIGNVFDNLELLEGRTT